MRTIWLLTLFLTVSTLSPVQASSIVLDESPSTLMQLLDEAGYEPRLETSEDQGTTIIIKDDSTELGIALEGCQRNTCDFVYISHALRTNALDTLFTEWNTTQFSQLYPCDGMVCLSSVYYLKGGYTQVNFLVWLHAFFKDLDELRQERSVDTPSNPGA